MAYKQEPGARVGTKYNFEEVKNAGLVGSVEPAVPTAKEARIAKRSQAKGIRQELRGALKEQKAVAPITGESTPADLDAASAAQAKVSEALHKKADIKDWSTRKRVKKGEKHGTQLHDDTGAVYEPGRKNVSAENVTQSDIGKDIGDIDKTRWKNIYTPKGEYKMTIPHEGGETDISDISIKIPPRPPKPPTPPEETEKKKIKSKAGGKKVKIKKVRTKGRYDAQKSHKRKGKKTKSYVRGSSRKNNTSFRKRGKG